MNNNLKAIDLIKSYNAKEVSLAAPSKRLIKIAFPTAIFVVCLSITATFYALSFSTHITTVSLKEYINNPDNQKIFSESINLKNKINTLSTYDNVMKEHLALNASVAEVTKQLYDKLNVAAGTDILIDSVGYSENALTLYVFHRVNSQCSKYVKTLSAFEEFDSVYYDGYLMGEGGFFSTITCTYNSPADKKQ